MKAPVARLQPFLLVLALFVAALVLTPLLARGDRARRGARASDEATRRTLGPPAATPPIVWDAPPQAD